MIHKIHLCLPQMQHIEQLHCGKSVLLGLQMLANTAVNLTIFPLHRGGLYGWLRHAECKSEKCNLGGGGGGGLAYQPVFLGLQMYVTVGMNLVIPFLDQGRVNVCSGTQLSNPRVW